MKNNNNIKNVVIILNSTHSAALHGVADRRCHKNVVIKEIYAYQSQPQQKRVGTILVALYFSHK
jgi:hypothetical protein